MGVISLGFRVKRIGFRIQSLGFRIRVISVLYGLCKFVMRFLWTCGGICV